MKVLGTIDINPVPVVTPAPLPAPVAGDAAMVVTPMISNSTLRSSRLSSITGLTLARKRSYTFAASTLLQFDIVVRLAKLHNDLIRLWLKL
jgi:hypothetical protein